MEKILTFSGRFFVANFTINILLKYKPLYGYVLKSKLSNRNMIRNITVFFLASTHIRQFYNASQIL